MKQTEALLVRFRREYPSLGYDYIHYYLLERGCREIPSKSMRRKKTSEL
jgi:hypothetical protein